MHGTTVLSHSTPYVHRDAFNESDLIGTGRIKISDVSQRGSELEIGLGTAK